MEFHFTGIVKVTMDHIPGSSNSKHVATDFRLQPGKNLIQDQYNDKAGLPTKSGSHALTQTFVQGLIGNIHYAHQKGYRDSADHLRYIIGELERGFAEVVQQGVGTM